MIEEIIKPEMGDDWSPTGVYYQGEMCDHRYIFLDGREPLNEDIDRDYHEALWGHWFKEEVKVTDYPVMVAETAGVTSVISVERSWRESGVDMRRVLSRAGWIRAG